MNPTGLPSKAGIYCIKNLINNKVYIGQTSHLRNRCKDHKRDLNKKRHRNKHLQNAVYKYKLENFKFIIIEVIEKFKDGNINDLRYRLTDLENYWMDYYNSTDKRFGYNTSGRNPCPTSYGCTGVLETNAKAVLQYSLDGQFIKEWSCIATVERKIGINDATISQCCKLHIKSAGGFQWRYKTKDYPLQIKPANNYYKPVEQYSRKGEFIKEWNTLKEAAESFPKTSKNPCYNIQELARICKQRASVFGFQWKYKDSKKIIKSLFKKKSIKIKKIKVPKFKFLGTFYQQKAKTWKAYVMFKSKSIYLGSFYSEEDAAFAYNLISKEFFPNNPLNPLPEKNDFEIQNIATNRFSETKKRVKEITKIVETKLDNL